MLDDQFYETEMFLSYYNPEDISNWMQETPVQVILSIVSEVRTRSPVPAAWADRIHRYLIFGEKNSQEESQRILGAFTSYRAYVIEQIIDMNKVGAIGARMGVAWRDGKLEPVNPNPDHHVVEVEPFDKFDEPTILTQWASVAPIDLLLGISNGISQRAVNVIEKTQSLLAQFTPDILGLRDLDNERKVKECFASIMHDSRMLIRVASVGIRYYHTKSE